LMGAGFSVERRNPSRTLPAPSRPLGSCSSRSCGHHVRQASQLRIGRRCLLAAAVAAAMRRRQRRRRVACSHVVRAPRVIERSTPAAEPAHSRVRSHEGGALVVVAASVRGAHSATVRLATSRLHCCAWFAARRCRSDQHPAAQTRALHFAPPGFVRSAFGRCCCSGSSARRSRRR
jgi:hypothetical protein